MTRTSSMLRASPVVLCVAVLAALGYFHLPFTGYYRYRPVLLLSEDAAREVRSLRGPAKERTVTRLTTKNVQGVVFREETLEDLERAGRAFAASGEEIVRLFKLQSVVSYYVYEQVREKNLEPAGAYIFFSEAAVFERVYAELKYRLPPDSIKIYERGVMRGDASFPDNYILESSLAPSLIRSVPLGWPVDHIARTVASTRRADGDTMWPVLQSDNFSAVRVVRLDTALPAAIELNPSYLRFPFDAMRIVRDPRDLLTLPRGSDMEDILSAPRLPAGAAMAMGIVLIIAAILRAAPRAAWAMVASAAMAVAAFTAMPAQKIWVVQGIAFLLPSSAMLIWMASANFIRSARHDISAGPKLALYLFAYMIAAVAAHGWLMAVLAWHFPDADAVGAAQYGLMILPALSALFLAGVWTLDASHHPVFPKDLLAFAALGVALSVICFSSSAYAVAASAFAAWALWLSNAMPIVAAGEKAETPGYYAALYAAAGLSVKLFFLLSPLTATVVLTASYAAGFGAVMVQRSRFAS